MNHYYIYNLDYKVKAKKVSATVIFFPGTNIDIDQLQQELEQFYTNYFQTDKTVIIAGSYISNLAEIIVEEKIKIFKYVPKIEESFLFENLHILNFDLNGRLAEIKHTELKEFDGFQNFKKQYLEQGIQKIFIERGGLIESTGSHHHYILPSGKHSNKFLRVANILLYSPEIYFIAFGLLKYFDSVKYKSILCDTSSINSVAIALNQILNCFFEVNIIYPIQSFKSYEGIYDKSINLKSSSFIIISASTSGNLFNKLRERHSELRKENIVMLFFLKNREPSNDSLDQVLCNLTKTSVNINGIENYETAEDNKCGLCEKGSFSVKVSGDVFLLEQPKVNSIRIDGNDMDVANSSPFINQFISFKRKSSVLKANYKETGDKASKKYEIYIDYGHIIDNIENKRFIKHKNKLDAYIDQYVPSNVKYILHLNDESSRKLAEYIRNKILDNYTINKRPELKTQDQFKDIESEKIGSILIVGSCITNGKNLLYLSRALRNYKLRIIYFIGITRPYHEEAYRFLKSNLKQGTYGTDNSTFIEVEKIYCSNLTSENPWQIEVEFLKKHRNSLDDPKLGEFLNERIQLIEDCFSNQLKGMSSNLFLPRIHKGRKNKELQIRRNSAFFNRDDYATHVSQSDVYFTISYVINKLRFSTSNHTLKQSVFVRNVISPENLNRFNDGIIQASILRATTSEELNYSIDVETSKQMKNILLTIFKYRNQEQGEALLEFLYTLAIKKLTLKEDHLKQLVQELDSETNYIIKFYIDIIKSNIDNKSTSN